MDSRAAAFDRLDSVLAQGGVGLQGQGALRIRAAKASRAMRIEFDREGLDVVTRREDHPVPAGVGGGDGRPEQPESNREAQANTSVRRLPA